MITLEPWRRTLYAVAIAQFIALGGGNLIFPFIPFYVEDLGVTDQGAIAIWSGLMGTATGVMLFIFSPIWGSLADRYGRKPLLLRAYIGAMVTMALQGLVQDVWQLVLLRALQGIFVGTIPAATALVAASTPRDRVAYALGVLQMALFSSQFIGPLVGGVLAEAIGFRTTFIATSGFYLISFLLVFYAVDEHFVRPTAEERGTFWGNLGLVLQRGPLAILIGVVFFLNLGPPYIRPLIPLLVDSFDPAASPEAIAGVCFAALAGTSAIAALASSRVSALAGYRNALALATVCAGAAYLPIAAAQSVTMLVVMIAIVGIFSGAMIPTANALIDSWTPEGRHASAFGLAGSAMALSFAVGPLTGGIVASAWGLDAAFIAIGSIMLCVGVLVLAAVREVGRASPEEAVEPVVRGVTD
jgi:DHA1 family multidrug resistance protein-like MFS transporter